MSKQRFTQIFRRIALAAPLALVLGVLLANPALAHDTPDGSEWVMADWIFITFAIFAGGALIAFVVALKKGLLSNIEDAKYQVLTIEEQDYYSG